MKFQNILHNTYVKVFCDKRLNTFVSQCIYILIEIFHYLVKVTFTSRVIKQKQKRMKNNICVAITKNTFGSSSIKYNTIK